MKKVFLLILILLTFQLVEADLQETLELEKNNLENLIPARKAGIALPIIFEVVTDEESLLVMIDDDGKISFPSNINPDLVIGGKEVNLAKFLGIESKQDLIETLNLISIEAITFKGKVAVEVGENLLDIEIMKEKSFSQRFIGFFVKPVVKITGFFIK